VAAPVFKGIAEQALAVLGIRRMAPAVPQGPPSEPPDQKPDMAPLLIAQKAEDENKAGNYDQSGSRIMPDIRGLSMRKALEVMRSYEVPVVVVGSGKAVAQTPLPGTVLGQRTRCQIQFQPVL
jgi:cell division protein FtsI (penicillin-binding protein 3)